MARRKHVETVPGDHDTILRSLRHSLPRAHHKRITRHFSSDVKLLPWPVTLPMLNAVIYLVEPIMAQRRNASSSPSFNLSVSAHLATDIRTASREPWNGNASFQSQVHMLVVACHCRSMRYQTLDAVTLAV